MNLLEFKKKFDLTIEKYLDKRLADIKEIWLNANVLKIVEYYNEYIIAWWKRIRPYVFYTTFMWMWGLSSKKAMELSMAFEIMHDALLIHDDIIDSWETRHWLLSFHKYIEKKIYKNNKDLSVSAAILAGDVLFGFAFEIMSNIKDLPSDVQFYARNEFYKMFEVVNIGQIFDTDYMSKKIVSYSDIKKKTFLKTASYTFIYPMRYAARLVWANKGVLENLTKLWTTLWLAVQMRDDLWDSLWMYKDKTPFSDIQAWQHTVVSDYVLRKWSPSQKIFLNKCFWKKISLEDSKKLVKVLNDSWAVDYTKWVIKDQLITWKEILKTISFKSKIYKDSFILFIDDIINSLK